MRFEKTKIRFSTLTILKLNSICCGFFSVCFSDFLRSACFPVLFYLLSKIVVFTFFYVLLLLSSNKGPFIVSVTIITIEITLHKHTENATHLHKFLYLHHIFSHLNREINSTPAYHTPNWPLIQVIHPTFTHQELIKCRLYLSNFGIWIWVTVERNNLRKIDRT